MSKNSNRKAIAELTIRVQNLESSVAKLGIAIESNTVSPRPSDITTAKGTSPAEPKKPSATKSARKKTSPAPTAPAKAAVKTPAGKGDNKQKPTLVEALKYVLAEHQKVKSGPVKATQLYDDVHHAGYQFGGTNRDNNRNYLYKLLRTNKAFKKAGEGVYSLA